ncbi:transcriptional regulator [Nonlabens tegetincola]|uniref:Transcriptional regulator n=1 Tax=Nonlabens tegetincola TaxID=323273 RepID=A0A090Q469_9FLAO|nr:transcriptional regulator [Nonlabens tegetincola]
MNHHKESRCENCVIRQLNSLKALSKEQLKEISDSKVTKSIKKGEVIFAEGERLHGVFCVRMVFLNCPRLVRTVKTKL